MNPVFLAVFLLLGDSAAIESPLPAVLPAMIPLPPSHFVPCDECEPGRFAWVTRSRRVKLSVAPGYPMRAHTSELGVEGRQGTVTVLGFFSSKVNAQLWRTRYGLGQVVELGHWPEHPVADGYVISRSVRIGENGATVVPEDAIDFKTPRSKLPSLCTLKAHTQYVLGPNEYTLFSQWVPATCANGKKGYVYKTDTWLDTAVKRESNGDIKIFQTTYVVCDMDTVDEWLWVDGTRKPVQGWAYDLEGNASGGCGAY